MIISQGLSTILKFSSRFVFVKELQSNKTNNTSLIFHQQQVWNFLMICDIQCSVWLGVLGYRGFVDTKGGHPTPFGIIILMIMSYKIMYICSIHGNGGVFWMFYMEVYRRFTRVLQLLLYEVDLCYSMPRNHSKNQNNFWSCGAEHWVYFDLVTSVPCVPALVHVISIPVVMYSVYAVHSLFYSPLWWCRKAIYYNV